MFFVFFHFFCCNWQSLTIVRIFFISLICLVVSSCSIRKKIEIGGDWSGRNSIFLCPTYLFTEKAEKRDKLVKIETNHVSLANKDFLVAREKVEHYIKQRGSLEFFNKLEFYDVEITSLDSLETLKNISSVGINKCGNTKYYFRYMFKNGAGISYRIGIALNEKYEVISKPSFPDHKLNSDFMQVLSPQKAHRMAMKHNRGLISPLEKMELLYDDARNCFVWHFTQAFSAEQGGDFDFGYMIIHSLSVELMKSGYRTAYVNVSSTPLMKKISKTRNRNKKER